MIGAIPPEWPLGIAVASLAWRLRPRSDRLVPQRGGTDANGMAARATTTKPARSRLSPLALLGRRRYHVDAAEAAAWCDGIARGLRSGSTLSDAIVRAPRTRAIDAAVGDAVLALERGSTTAEVVEQIDRDAASNHLALVATVLRTLATHGGPAAEPVDRAASVLRQRAAAEAERATQSAQARLSARVMTLLPVAMLSIVSITSASVRSALLTPIGMMTVMAGVCCNLVGWLWMRRIIAGGRR